jgi:hypothetical protein
LANQSSNWAGLPLLVLLFLLCLPLASLHAESWRYSNVERIVALGDVHGAYDPLVQTLQSTGVIDEDLAWSGGNTHLVFTGDFLDRGADSRLVMDLVMRLESEAAEAGGRVHMTLGNHEVMNIIGDLRYVADAEFAAFTDDESPAERERWYQEFRKSQSDDVEEVAVRTAFNEKAPPGYFGHRAAFRQDGVYGNWLLEKPLLIVVNDTAFVHGGLPPYVAEHGLEDVNAKLKADLLSYVTARSELEDAGILSPLDRFKELPSILSGGIDAGRFDDALLDKVQAVLEHKDSPLNRPKGPTWYRGSSICSNLVEGDGLSAALQRVGAKRVAVGHTTATTRRIQQRMKGRVLQIDTGILASVYNGSGNALIIEGDALSIISQAGDAGLSPIGPPRRVGYESKTLDDEMLERILTHGTVTDAQGDDAAWQVVTIDVNGKAVPAYFNPSPDGSVFAPELAAYRLDRLLGLDMVPVTVRREIDGKRGTLQFVPETTLSERDRLAGAKWRTPICSLEKQWRAMYVFDLLINNSARSPLSMLYYPDDWQLLLLNHEHAFSRAEARPAYLQNKVVVVGEEWRTALLELDDKRLRANLGDVLDRRRLSALAKRRDALIRDSRR